MNMKFSKPLKSVSISLFVIFFYIAFANAHVYIGPGPFPPPNFPKPPPCPSGTCCDKPGGPDKIVYQSGEETFKRMDMVVNDVYPIKIARTYSSNTIYDSPLGYGWAFDFNKSLFEYPDQSIVIRHGCGNLNRYLWTGGGYVPDTSIGSQNHALVKNPDDSFTVTYPKGEKDTYDSQGRLIATFDVAGNSLEFSYDLSGKFPLWGSSPNALEPGKSFVSSYVHRLMQITVRYVDGATGNFVTFAYKPDTGRVDTITSNDGRVVSYQHDVTTDNKTLGNLIGVTGLDNKVSIYKYEDQVGAVFQDYHNITHIQEGVNALPVNITYNNLDQAYIESVGNSTWTYNFDNAPANTTVTETIRDDEGLNPVPAVKYFEFDGVGFIEFERDALDNETRYTLDNFGNKLKEEIYQGSELTGTLVKVIDRTFDGNANPLTEATTLSSGEVITTTWTYDGTQKASETIISSLNPTKIFKTVWVYNYDIGGNATTVKEEHRYKDNGTDFTITAYAYNGHGNILTTALPNTSTGTHVIVNDYGAAYGGRYITKTYHEIDGLPVAELEENYQYDVRGNQTHVTDKNNNTTITTYDNSNRRTTVTNAEGHLTTYEYDARGNIEFIRRDRSVNGDQLDVTKLTYDGENRLTQIERTDENDTLVVRSTIKYNSAGDVIARGDAYGAETLLAYDLDHRLQRITDDDGNYIEYTLNALDQRTKTEYYAAGGVIVRTSSAVFDELDRQQQMIGALNQTTTFTYDAKGNRITATDAENRPTTTYTYDTLSRLTNIKDANYDVVRDNQTSYQYDDRDQLRFVTDPEGRVTEYQYNNLGQLQFLISPDTGTTEYTYDEAGNRKTQTDARDITVTFDYDSLNRITSKTYPGTNNPLNVTYTYDERTNGLGKLTGMVDGQGSTEYDYDAFGNLAEKRRDTNGQIYTTQYTYDDNDRLSMITYNSGRTVVYTRNTLGQVTAVTTTPNGGAPQTVATNMTYLPFGALEDMDWGNTLSLDQTFDSDYRLTNQALGSVYDRTYEYDLVNNIETITDNTAGAKTQSFNYDVLDRLDDATGTNTYGVIDYGYDDVGNRKTLKVGLDPVINYDYSVTANNRLDTIDGVAVGYDANGNTTSKDGIIFTYDDMNRMSQVNNASVVTSYGFNGKGERVLKAGVSTTLYHYDESGNLLFESDTSGNATVEYIWLGNQRLAMVQGGSLYYMHTDHLGTVQLLTDGVGDVAWSGDYGPFGEVVVNPASTVTYNLRFPGQYYDGESGLHYNYFRDYDPSLGRYVESDPIGLDGGLNTYAYVGGNPIRFIDILGLACGPGLLGTIAAPLTDTIGGNDFTEACEGHDDCYAECGKSKSECDTDFRDAMISSCTAAIQGSLVIVSTGCTGAAGLYYNLVKNEGQSSYDNAQKENCCD